MQSKKKTPDSESLQLILNKNNQQLKVCMIQFTKPLEIYEQTKLYEGSSDIYEFALLLKILYIQKIELQSTSIAG